MVARPQPPRWSVEAYLAMERGSPIKHDYIDGHVYAMAGGSRRHSRISVNVTTLLNVLLRGANSPCQVFNSDMKVHVDAKNYVYPDASVSCDARDVTDGEADYISHPIMVVEVLSDDSTAGYDRGDKFDLLYKQIEALQEYVLVDTQKMAIDVYRRAGASWSLQSFGPDDTVVLESISVSSPIAAFYERIT